MRISGIWMLGYDVAVVVVAVEYVVDVDVFVAVVGVC